MLEHDLCVHRDPPDGAAGAHHHHVQHSVVDHCLRNEVDAARNEAAVGEQHTADLPGLFRLVVQGDGHLLAPPRQMPDSCLRVGEPAHRLFQPVVGVSDDFGIHAHAGNHQECVL
ncbi:hypothetical protein D9M72_410790 [compost metagenome]